jgi:hypothetical protein
MRSTTWGATLTVARKEVITVPTEMLTKNERTVSQPTPAAIVPADESREWARKHVERIHRLKLNVAVFALGMIVLTPLWALIEWQDNGAFERWSNNSNPGDWEPWILYVALIWGGILALSALKVHFDRPTTDA